MKKSNTTFLAMALTVGVCWAQSEVSQNVKVELISEVESIKPGEKFWVALKLEMAPEWHTYWRNPGDAGLPTKINWSLPDDFTVSDIYWPYPEIFEVGGVVSYGYKNEILLLSEMIPPSEISSDNIKIEAEVSWLECKEMCLPGIAELSLILPVINHQPQYDNRWTDNFIKSRDMLPIKNYDLTYFLDQTDSSIIIESLTSNRKLLNTEKVKFLPYDEGIYNNSKPQVFKNTDTGFTIEVMFADFKVGDPESISGLLKIEKPGSNPIKAIEIRIPIEAEEQKNDSLNNQL